MLLLTDKDFKVISDCSQTGVSSEVSTIMDFLLNNPKLRCRDIAAVEKKIKRIIEDGVQKLMVGYAFYIIDKDFFSGC